MTAPVIDRCPGILDLHPAADGLMARIRIPGSHLTGRRLARLASMARTCGDGHLDLTSRGNVQVRGLSESSAAALARTCAATGFLPDPAHDRARNIVASPLHGLGGRPSLTKLVDLLDRAIRREPALAWLGGRFLFAVRCDDVHVPTADVALVVSGPTTGVALEVGGRPTGIVGGRQRALAGAITVARHVAEAGTTATRGLPDEGRGVVEVLGGRWSPRDAVPPGRLPLGPHVDGAVIAAAPLARLTNEQARAIARLAPRGSLVRIAPAGRIVVPCPAGATGPLAGRLRDAGLVVDPDDQRASVTACSGSGCLRCVRDPRAAARALDGPTHWVGCSRGCGRPHDAALVVPAHGGWARDGDAVPA